jgi:hypothetical protein
VSEYLDFVMVHDTGKTKVYSVDSRSQGARLGLLKWYGPWRQYTLMPEPDTVWNKTCLLDITAFIDGLMRERAHA